MATSRLTVGLIALVGLIAVAGPARADKPHDAELRFRDGQHAYRDGYYARALAAFEAGYRLDPRPEFLLNIAQCQRSLGDLETAAASLERFIAEAPRHRLRPAAEQALADIRAELAARAARTEPADEPADEPAADQPAADQPAADQPAAPVHPRPHRIDRPRLAAADEPDPALVRAEPAPSAHRTWIWLGAGAGVVATVGVIVLLASQRGADQPFDTIHLPPP